VEIYSLVHYDQHAVYAAWWYSSLRMQSSFVSVVALAHSYSHIVSCLASSLYTMHLSICFTAHGAFSFFVAFNNQYCKGGFAGSTARGVGADYE
jgi:hypothetical protein